MVAKPGATFDGRNRINIGINGHKRDTYHLSTGTGFLPSTVGKSTNYTSYNLVKIQMNKSDIWRGMCILTRHCLPHLL
jgi:hypothetical protein